jgi:hypothetical protein
MLSFQQISDRLEIEEVLVNYTYAVDRHDWDLFDVVFTEDANIDYTEIAEWKGDREGIKHWLSQAMPEVGTYFHMTATANITVDGDRAESRILCYNPIPVGDEAFVLYGHWYRDKWIRTPEGWRINDRYFEISCHQVLDITHPAAGPSEPGSSPGEKVHDQSLEI